MIISWFRTTLGARLDRSPVDLGSLCCGLLYPHDWSGQGPGNIGLDITELLLSLSQTLQSVGIPCVAVPAAITAIFSSNSNEHPEIFGLIDEAADGV